MGVSSFFLGGSKQRNGVSGGDGSRMQALCAISDMDLALIGRAIAVYLPLIVLYSLKAVVTIKNTMTTTRLTFLQSMSLVISLRWVCDIHRLHKGPVAVLWSPGYRGVLPELFRMPKREPFTPFG